MTNSNPFEKVGAAARAFEARSDEMAARIKTLGSRPSERLTITLAPDAIDALAALQVRTGLSKTDVLNRAVQIYNMLDEATRNGSEVLLRTPRAGTGGEIERVRFL